MLTRLTPIVILSLLTAAQAAAVLPPDEDARARRLINAQGCKACHALEGAGGTRSASLETIASRSPRERIRAQLAGGSGRHADGRIADFNHLSDADIDALTLFIKDLAAIEGKKIR